MYFALMQVCRLVGPARADIYWGAGNQAGHIAGRIRHPGKFAMLVPRELDPVAAGARMPLPREKPPPAAKAQLKSSNAKFAASRPPSAVWQVLPLPGLSIPTLNQCARAAMRSRPGRENTYLTRHAACSVLRHTRHDWHQSCCCIGER